MSIIIGFVGVCVFSNLPYLLYKVFVLNSFSSQLLALISAALISFFFPEFMIIGKKSRQFLCHLVKPAIFLPSQSTKICISGMFCRPYLLEMLLFTFDRVHRRALPIVLANKEGTHQKSESFYWDFWGIIFLFVCLWNDFWCLSGILVACEKTPALC